MGGRASPTEPREFRGTRMLEAEAVVAASGWPATSLRLGGIYGPGRTRLIESVRSGRAAIRPVRRAGATASTATTRPARSRI